MNLVAKEFLATRFRGRGELILSEFAGAAEELPEARLVNPHDNVGLMNALVEAYGRALRGEAPAATAELHRRVIDHDVHDWAESFLTRLVAVGRGREPGRRGRGEPDVEVKEPAGVRG
jgi:trehalose 6-phosphate synthase